MNNVDRRQKKCRSTFCQDHLQLIYSTFVLLDRTKGQAHNCYLLEQNREMGMEMKPKP